ncbi:aquaporin [Streptomyces sp. NPDC005408]|uniref:MIP/aquaporin family protein n=1 Tax=Streptomyces sp. NPDC005408 TaxID=3155341 RepID=UPI00339DC6BA
MSAPEPHNADIVRTSAYEFALTTVLFFVVVSLVRWLAVPDSPLAISGPHALFAVAGVLVAAVIIALMYSPPGRISGGHLNPGVTVFLWTNGLFPGKSVAPYITAQLAGSVAGAGLARIVWGKPVSQTGYAAVHPAQGTGTVGLFAIESASLGAVFILVALVMAQPKFIPLAVGAGVGIVIATLGTVSGASINPARDFGPALLSGQYDHFWTYMIAPLVGAAAVGLARRRLRTANRRNPRSAPATPAS